LKDGVPLRAGSRFKTFHDFGFVILEIGSVYTEDGGKNYAADFKNTITITCVYWTFNGFVSIQEIIRVEHIMTLGKQ